MAPHALEGRALCWVSMACRGLSLSPLWSVQAYQSLAILEATSTMAQRALESNSKLKGNDSRNISAYFNKASAWPCLCAGTGCAMQSMHHTEHASCRADHMPAAHAQSRAQSPSHVAAGADDDGEGGGAAVEHYPQLCQPGP